MDRSVVQEEAGGGVHLGSTKKEIMPGTGAGKLVEFVVPGPGAEI